MHRAMLKAQKPCMMAVAEDASTDGPASTVLNTTRSESALRHGSVASMMDRASKPYVQ